MTKVTMLSATSEIIDRYNAAAEAMGEKSVKKFRDKRTALRRTNEILARVRARDLVRSKAESKPTAAPAPRTRKKRGMRFVFRPETKIRECKGTARTNSKDKRSLRHRAVDLLLKGASFTEVVALVKQFDKECGKEPKFLDRRAYELVRIVHYYLGYGLRQDSSGRITAYTN